MKSRKCFWIYKNHYLCNMKSNANILFFILALILTGCSGKEPETPMTAVASIATYESTADGVSTFSYTDNNNDLITLSAAWKGNADLKAGKRVLIYYTASEYGVSGQISLLSVTPLPGGAPKQVDLTEIPESEPMQQCSVWKSGQYLNLSSIVTFGGAAKEVSLYIDESTSNQQIPDAYIVVVPENNGVVGVERALYASWDISSILAAPDFQGLKVKYTDSANQLTEIKIDK